MPSPHPLDAFWISWRFVLFSQVRQASASCCCAPSRVAAQPMRGLSSGSTSTQLIDQLQPAPVVPPICFLSEPTMEPLRRWSGIAPARGALAIEQSH